MDIGGDSIVIENPKRTDYFRAIREVWPEAVMERDEVDPNDLFVYKTAAARDSWMYPEAGQTTVGQAVFVISQPFAVVLVVDDESDPETQRILNLFR